MTVNDVFVVWYCKTLQNHKALLSTPVSDGMYYEITYNGDKNEIYFDAYKNRDTLICYKCQYYGCADVVYAESDIQPICNKYDK